MHTREPLTVSLESSPLECWGDEDTNVFCLFAFYEDNAIEATQSSDPTEQNILESLIGISDLKEPGRQKNVTVPLFNAEAPAVDQYGRSGPLEESQPLIAIPHVNNTGEAFDLTKADGGGLRGDVAYDDEQGIAKLGGLQATNVLATVLLKDADQAEVRSARQETAAVRREFSGRG